MGDPTVWIGTLISCYGKLYIHQLFLGGQMSKIRNVFFVET